MLLLRPAGMPGITPAQAVIDLPLCDVHKDTRPAAYITDDSWASIVAQFAKLGKAIPTRSETTVVFVGIPGGRDGEATMIF